MNWLGQRLGFNEINDWYKIIADDILRNGGSRLLAHFKSSPSLLVSTVYPEHKWDIHQFSSSKEILG